MTDLATEQLVDIPIGDVKPDPDNIRRRLDDEVVAEIANTIPTLGIIEPLIVSQDADGDGFTIIAGHQRLAAAAKAGLEFVPCIVRAPVSEIERLMMQVVENRQRASLTPLEEADAYRRLVTLKVSQRDLADRVGCSQSHVSKRLSLTKLPDAAQTALDDGRLTVAQAEDLTRLEDAAAVERIVALGGGDITFAIGRAVRRQEERAKVEGWKKAIADAGVPELDQDARYDDDKPWRETRDDEKPNAAYIGWQGIEWLVEGVDDEDDLDGTTDADAHRAAMVAQQAELEKADAEWTVAAERRKAFIRSHLESSKLDLKAAQAHTNQRILEQAAEYYLEYNTAAACEMLGIKYDQDADDLELGGAELLAYAALTAKAQVKSLLALVVADDEPSVRYFRNTRDGAGLDRSIERHYAYLEAAGYEPSDIECAAIARITTPVVDEKSVGDDEEESE